LGSGPLFRRISCFFKTFTIFLFYNATGGGRCLPVSQNAFSNSERWMSYIPLTAASWILDGKMMIRSRDAMDGGVRG
jgi:hypothetical protein